MIFKLLACDVITREACYCIARCPHAVSPVFNLKGEHNEPDRLRARLQSQIDGAAAEGVAYDAVLLGYGLCGNAATGLVANTVPLVIPRAHDCTTLFLGSKEAFQCHFGQNPSQCWASVGYSERGDTAMSDNSTRKHLGLGQAYEELVAQYGEENAAYLIEMLRTEHGSSGVHIIDVPETRVESVLDRIRAKAAAENKTVSEITGSIGLIQRLLSGQWPEEEFLVVPPGHRIVGVYDMEEVVSARPAQHDTRADHPCPVLDSQQA